MALLRHELEERLPAGDSLSRIDQMMKSKLREAYDDKCVELYWVMLRFLKYFEPFRDSSLMIAEVFEAAMTALELLEAGTVEELDQLLQKATLMRFVDAYVEYAGLGQKEKIFDVLSGSLEILAPQALFLNLGVLVKPVFASKQFQEDRAKQVVAEVEYSAYRGGESDLEIKHAIDRWIKAQSLDLDRQDALRNALGREFARLAAQHGLREGTDDYERLLFEVNEMLTMQLTLVSLGEMAEDDEDLSPVPLS